VIRVLRISIAPMPAAPPAAYDAALDQPSEAIMLKPKSSKARRPAPKKIDRLNATKPALPRSPEKRATIDDPTVRLQNHNELPRRDPSGARGNRNALPGQTRRSKTRR